MNDEGQEFNDTVASNYHYVEGMGPTEEGRYKPVKASESPQFRAPSSESVSLKENTSTDLKEPVEGIGKEVKEEKSERTFDGTSRPGEVSDYERIAVGKALGFDNFNDLHKYQDQTDRIIEWAKFSGAKSTGEVVMKIHELKGLVGMSANLYTLSVYAGLELESKRIEQQMKTIKGVK